MVWDSFATDSFEDGVSSDDGELRHWARGSGNGLEAAITGAWRRAEQGVIEARTVCRAIP